MLSATHLHTSIAPIESPDGRSHEWLVFEDELRARLATDNWRTALRLGLVNPLRLAEPESLPDDAPGGDCGEHGPYSGDDCDKCDCWPLCARCRAAAARMLYGPACAAGHESISAQRARWEVEARTLTEDGMLIPF